MEMKRKAERLGGLLIRKKAKRLLAIVLAGLMVNSVIGYGVVVNAEEVVGITVDTDNESIYANGKAIIIADKDGNAATTTDTVIYLDINETGIVDSGQTPVTLTGVSGSVAEGYDLGQYNIFGGSQSASVSTTKVTMQGGRVQNIYGGGATGSVSGNTNVTINGGIIQNRLYGGAYYGTVQGDINVTVIGGTIQENVYGGGENGNVTGDIHVTIDGGTIQENVYGDGNDCAVGGSTNVTMNGGTVGMVQSGGRSDIVPGNRTVTINGGTIRTVAYTGTIRIGVDAPATIYTDHYTFLEYEVAFYDGTTKLANPRPQWITAKTSGYLNTGNTAAHPGIMLRKEGKIFEGWKTADNSNYDFTEPVTSAIKLYAVWVDAPTYAVTYNGNGNTGGSVPVEGKTYYDGANVPLAGNTGNLSKTGYTFVGWSTTPNGEAITSYTMTSEPVTFYAVWLDVPTYAVTYNGNGNTGGSVPVESKTYYDGANVTLAGNTGNLSKTGYTFVGWGTTPNGEAITSYTMSTEPVTFYAVWKSIPTNNTGGSSSSGGSSSGGGSSLGSSTPAAAANTPAAPASPTSPEAIKQAEEAIAGLTTTQKQETSKNLQEYLPYTSLAAKELTLEQLQKLTNNQLTKETMETIIQKPELLKALGIDVAALSTTVLLKPVEHPEYKDVAPSHWASDTIQKAAQLGLVAGNPDGTFAPSAPLQVADTFTFLDRVLLLNNITASTLPRSTVEKHITDKEHWAFNHMASIASKLSEQTLKTISEAGDKPLTRELLAQVLYEITKGKLKAAKEVPAFTDTKSSPYQEAIDYCVAAGLLNGTGNNTMSPQKELTRAEMMTILIRLDKMLK